MFDGDPRDWERPKRRKPTPHHNGYPGKRTEIVSAMPSNLTKMQERRFRQRFAPKPGL